MNLKIGDTAELTQTLTDEIIESYAEVSGDENPIHLDEEAAAESRFGERIGHGMWTASLVSAVLGTKLPGPVTIYLEQTLEFRAPVYIGDEVTARVTVESIDDEKSIATLQTTCQNQDGDLVLEGEATVLVEDDG